jgi:hypothetical protein
MATVVKRIETSTRIRVALVIESGKIKPVWFEESGKPANERVFIKEVSYVWTHMEGAAKIISFAVWDGSNSYQLALNTRNFTWRLDVAETSPC